MLVLSVEAGTNHITSKSPPPEVGVGVLLWCRKQSNIGRRVCVRQQQPIELMRVGLLVGLKIVPKEAEKEFNFIVEGTHEGLARGLARRLLERLKGVACGF